MVDMTLDHGSGGVCRCQGLVGYVGVPLEGAELDDGSLAVRWATVHFETRYLSRQK